MNKKRNCFCFYCGKVTNRELVHKTLGKRFVCDSCLEVHYIKNIKEGGE